MSYEIFILPKAEKQLFKLPTKQLLAIDNAIMELANNPRPNGCKKLAGSDSHYRIRVGNYRVIYSVFDDILQIEIIKIAHRKDAY